MFTTATAFDNDNREYPRVFKRFDPIEIRPLLPCNGVVLNLMAVVCHIGSSLNHGHYIAYILSTGCWFRVDDANVAHISDGNALLQRLSSTRSEMSHSVAEIPYLLLYKKSSGTIVVLVLFLSNLVLCTRSIRGRRDRQQLG